MRTADLRLYRLDGSCALFAVAAPVAEMAAAGHHYRFWGRTCKLLSGFIGGGVVKVTLLARIIAEAGEVNTVNLFGGVLGARHRTGRLLGLTEVVRLLVKNLW